MAESFSEKTIGYLVELRARNDREWYYAHKADYERYVLKPFQSLVTALAPAIQRIDPEIETAPAVGKTISRVYRDARFTHDKSLYRDRAWITFERKIDAPDVPAFYFELTPANYRYGVGFYNVSLRTMNEYRAMIDRGEDEFLCIIGDIAAAGVFSVEGESYKRSRYAGRHPEIAEWYDRKNIYIAANRAGLSEAFDFDALARRLEEGFSALAEIYRYWLRAASLC